jgi:hypothetical protein
MSAVEIRHDEGALTVLAPDEMFTYRYGASRRPFVHPLRTPSGLALSNDAPDDHPWHHALWFTIKFVNGENFWEEYDDYGVLRHVDPPEVTTTDDGTACSIAGDLDWIRPDRETVVIRESRRWSYRRLDRGGYALDLDTTLTPSVDVVLDRTPFTTWGGYGGLAFRGRSDFRDTVIRLADGTVTDRVEGHRSDWFDLSGVVDGREAGVTVIDAPANPSYPVPWYGSTRHETYDSGADEWSNFFNAAFLWHGPRTVDADQSLRFRYRVVVHDGPADPSRLDALTRDFHREVER